MSKKYYYQCNVCGRPGVVSNIVSDTCECGGRYIRQTVTSKKSSKSGQGMHRQPGITMKKRRTPGFKRSA